MSQRRRFLCWLIPIMLLASAYSLPYQDSIPQSTLVGENQSAFFSVDMITTHWITSAVDHEWVRAYGYSAGENITIVVTESDHATVKGASSATTQIYDWSGIQPVAHFDLEGLVDLIPGDYVDVSNGSVSISMRLALVSFLELNPLSDMAYGNGPAGETLELDVWDGNDPPIHVTDSVVVNGQGKWEYDFSGSFDIVDDSFGHVIYTDNNSNQTMAHPPHPPLTRGAGYFYDEITGKIIPEGSITVTGPGVTNLKYNGTDGYYQYFTDGTPGTYSINVTLPAYWNWSDSCIRQDPPSFDPTNLLSPILLGNGEDSSSGYLTSSDCTDFYQYFDLDIGDPEILNNNFPIHRDHHFSDLYIDHWAFPWVEAIANAGLTSGYPDGTYQPENPVTRAEMAVFLLNGMGITPPTLDGSHPFSDISGHWAEAYIEELYDQGITGGYPDGTYRPESLVTRAEMAVFLLNAMSVNPPTLDGSHPFIDVAGHWAEIFIEELYDQGITGGFPDGTYRPENRVTRAEMAVFLVNAFNIPLP